MRNFFDSAASPAALVLALLIGVVSFGAGCGRFGSKAPSFEDAEVIAEVEGDPITRQDLKRELALLARRDPSFRISPDAMSDQLDTMINRKLLIQEARRRKLTEDEKFVAAIKTYWEQTLVRELMGRMYAEFTSGQAVSEREIADYYEKLKFNATFDLTRHAEKSRMDELVAELDRGKEISWEKRLGPVSFQQITSPFLAEAFDLEPGQYRTYQHGDYYYLVRLSVKETSSPPPMDKIRDRIQNAILQQRQQSLFDEWLDRTRRNSHIRIKKDLAPKDRP